MFPSALLEKVLAAILELLAADADKDLPVLSMTIALLCSIPGIGLITAATVLAEIGDFSSFSNPDKLVAFFGIDPSVKQSGQFEGTQNRMSKRGSRLLRRVLFTTALAIDGTKPSCSLGGYPDPCMMLFDSLRHVDTASNTSYKTYFRTLS